MGIRQISKFVTATFLAAALAAFGGRAMAIDVTATCQGKQVVIGDIAASAGIFGPTTGVETGTFFLNDEYKHLMDDTHGCQFRWVQIITSDTCPAQWNKNDITFGVDPPSGGWDYQQKDGGADTSPFYENDDNGAYAYPNYANRHDASIGKSWTDDFPGICDGKNVNTTWETYLVFYNPNKMDSTFDVLTGYSWSMGRDGNGAGANGNPIFTGPDFFGSIGQGNLNDLNAAMANTGFGNWTAETGADICDICTPEPSTVATMVVFGAGLLLLIVRRRALRGSSAA